MDAFRLCVWAQNNLVHNIYGILKWVSWGRKLNNAHSTGCGGEKAGDKF